MSANPHSVVHAENYVDPSKEEKAKKEGPVKNMVRNMPEILNQSAPIICGVILTQPGRMTITVKQGKCFLDRERTFSS